jgi:hypothetical protein
MKYMDIPGWRRAVIVGYGAGFRSSLAILVIGLLPGLLVAQVPRPGDDRPELPDFVEGEGAATWSLPTIVAQVDAASAGYAEDMGSVPGTSQSVYVVQLGAFADSANAARLLADLETRGHQGTIQRVVNADGVELAQVLVGPFATRDAALEAQTLTRPRLQHCRQRRPRWRRTMRGPCRRQARQAETRTL